MRSRTESHLPGRCKRCYLKQRYCLCGLAPKLVTRTKLVVIRHEREAYKSTNTARIAALALPSLEIWPYAGSSEALDAQVAALPNACLVFPDDAPAERPMPEPVETLVLLDGTWRQTRRMLRRVPPLRALPRLVLRPPPAAAPRLRQAPTEGSVSTLEAIAAALAELESPALRAPLLQLQADFVARTLAGRGEP